jgi:signal transduction histidine kinase
MRPKQRISPASVILVAGLVVTLAVLAVFQYRWIGRVSDAERDRMRSNLNAAVEQFRSEFNRELVRLCAASQIDRPALLQKDWNGFAQLYEERTRQVPAAELVDNIFIWDAGRIAGQELLRLERESVQFVPASWPPELAGLRNLPPWPGAGFRRFPQEVRPLAWTMVFRIPALVHRLVLLQPAGEGRGLGPDLIGYLIIELNLELMKTEFIPELARRYFAGPQGFIYRVAIFAGASPATPIYQSDLTLSAADFASADARIGLLWEPREYVARLSPDVPARNLRNPGEALRRPPGLRPQGQIPPRAPRIFAGPALLPAGAEDNWELAARYSGGSLEAVVGSLRRRNLAISFGILLLLGLSMAMVILSTQRARRLARLQMDFVAGVSHELRTPLAVICSAADNLAEGVVSGSDDQVRRYGELVRNEGRRLTQMVEQLLQYAGRQTGKKKMVLRLVQVGEIVDTTLADLHSLIEPEGFVVEKTIEPGLPLVQADPGALVQCLRNLINNAMRYGGDSKWFGIRGRKAVEAKLPEVQLTVEDRGMGIEPDDLPYIFDPFYRGKAAQSAQSPGSGLGLSLTKGMIESMGGKISVKSVPGAGSSFTLHLPCVWKERRTD